MATNAVFAMKQGDLLPSLRVQLYDPPTVPGGPPVAADLSAATGIVMRMRPHGTVGELLVDDGAASHVGGGVVRYDWQAGETDVVGLMELEFTVMFPEGPMSYPSDEHLLLRIVEALA